MVIIMDFSKFDKAIDVEGLKADVASAQDNSSGGNYREVPKGEYEVSITKLELTASKKGDPMVTIWFRIVSGDYENSLIFMNQVITQGFQIHIVNELLREMCEKDVKFESYSQYGELLMDIHEEIEGNYEFALEYGERKGFNTFKINERFLLEG